MKGKAPIKSEGKIRDVVLVGAALVIIITGAKFAAEILAPFLLSLFIAVLCGTPIESLKRRGLPSWLSFLLVGAGIVTALFIMVLLLGSTVESFNTALPEYQVQLQALANQWIGKIENYGIAVNQGVLTDILAPSSAMKFFGDFLAGLGGTLSNIVLIIFTVIFLLVDASSFPGKLAMNKGADAENILILFRELVAGMNSYIATKTMVSLLTGFLIWLGLVLMGVEFAILWGFLAFFLNFIPNIGSALAAIPVVLLSLLEADPVYSGMIITLYLGVNLLVGNVIEPAVMGQKVGLSTLGVFLSLVFWGWMFGSIGMLLSVPLTMVLKFITQQQPETAWFALLISNLPAEETENSILNKKFNK